MPNPQSFAVRVRSVPAWSDRRDRNSISSGENGRGVGHCSSIAAYSADGRVHRPRPAIGRVGTTLSKASGYPRHPRPFSPTLNAHGSTRGSWTILCKQAHDLLASKQPDSAESTHPVTSSSVVASATTSSAHAPSSSSPSDDLPDSSSTTASPRAREDEAAFNHSRIQADGNEAAARIAYHMSETAFVFPITPSTPMAEQTEAWAASLKRNAFGNPMAVVQMESEAGAAGALHGGVSAGSMATTFTCSQGLLLMIPNMYKIAGELAPCVMHVTARALAKHALSIYGDHQDVMGVRQTGWAMLCSHTVQEAHDMALVAHLATLRSNIPFVHFFDGFRTSHEINSIAEISASDIQRLMKKTIYQEAIHRHRDRAMNPMHPNQRGTAQSPDIYFQCCEAANPWYGAAADHVEAAMKDVFSITGRHYAPFDYVGDPDAEDVVIMMGSGSQAAEEAVQHLTASGRHVGVLKVRLYRPWSDLHLMRALPVSTQRICVLDRTKESGAPGEPLYMDVSNVVREYAEVTGIHRMVVGGRYGLGGKEFTPAMAVAAFDNLRAEHPVRSFSVGIKDDVSGKSLQVGPEFSSVPPGTKQCVFWGLGSDGTVGANKDAVKIIGNNTDLFAQAYFAYDAKKSGGITVSHLRFGPEPINSTYLVQQADYLAVHLDSYMNKYDVLEGLKPGGCLVLNTKHTSAGELEAFLKPSVRRQIADLGIELYAIDARAVAELVGLGRRINMVMQTVFFSLADILPMDKAIPLLKEAITKTYSKKGPEVVEQNHFAVDNSLSMLTKIAVPSHWAKESLEQPPVKISEAFSAKDTMSKWRYIESVVKPVLSQKGDGLPVSVFSADGFVPPGTTLVEKRGIAAEVPSWKADACTECNICSFVCPHAAIRPFLLDFEEASRAPAGFATIPGKGKDIHEFQYRMQVSPADCTGCNLCTKACPTSALVPTPLQTMIKQETANWDFATALPERGAVLDKRATVRGSQFQPPMLEFSGACEGCQETSYVKLLTQLFGDHLIMANATGCSSIWGGSAPTNPYTTDKDGFGPAWANSLFEDNAQFGMGIATASKQRRLALYGHVHSLLKEESCPISPELRAVLDTWADVWQDAHACTEVSKAAAKLLTTEVKDLKASGVSPAAALMEIWEERDQLVKPTIWMVGGDGWAYDIGFGGLDHVMASDENVNILVLDTEMYSNTGGQRSKATPPGSIAKLASGGKVTPKKDLGQIAMTYGNVYVASVNLGANQNQVVKALAEAEAHDGVSLVIGYAPCGLHGLEGGMGSAHEHCHQAAESGYWPLYRYRPGEEGALHLDSNNFQDSLQQMLDTENRFKMLKRGNKEMSDKLTLDLDDTVRHRMHNMKSQSKTKTFRSNLPPFTLTESFEAGPFSRKPQEEEQEKDE